MEKFPLKEQLWQFIQNPILLSCIFSWFGAQFLKTVISLIFGKIHSISELIGTLIWKTGGMPSSHSALVSSLCTTIAFKDGLQSDIFILSLCFFLVVIRDAFGVRRSSGMQAKKLNEIGKELEKKDILKKYVLLKEVNGHSPMEVLFGCLLGFLIGLSFSLLK